MTIDTQDPGIEIPIVEIADGWTVDDIETEDDCDDAFAYLTGAVAAIEARIDYATLEAGAMSPDIIRMKAALRWKKAALAIVQTKRGRIKKQAMAEAQRTHDRLVIEAFKRHAPETFMEVVSLLEEQG